MKKKTMKFEYELYMYDGVRLTLSGNMTGDMFETYLLIQYFTYRYIRYITL